MLYCKTGLPFLRLAFVVCVSLLSVQASTRIVDHNRLNTLDEGARIRLNAAMRELRKRGIRPRVNSTFRSQAEQKALYRCARNKGCRARRGVYGANQPGTSLHEAGLAVDLGGIAAGRRHRSLTPKGRQTVRVMRKHGFDWRYGLKDPAHFEVSPESAGYRSKQAAIEAGQRRWLKTHRAKRQAKAQTRSNAAAGHKAKATA
jgi:LAS superfamily LD-carboxypeptidase LdcB